MRFFSDNMTETRDDRLGHRMLKDNHVIDLCHSSSTTISEDRVQRRVCPDHHSGASHDAIRSKYDVSMVELVVIANEKDAVRPKRDMDAEKSFENDRVPFARLAQRQASRKRMQMTKQQHKKYQNEMLKNTSEYETIRRLMEGRRNIARGEKQHLNEVSKQIRSCIRNIFLRQARNNGSLKSSEASKTFPAYKSAKKRTLIPTVQK